jgi:hypothetical protein
MEKRNLLCLHLLLLLVFSLQGCVILTIRTATLEYLDFYLILKSAFEANLIITECPSECTE